MNRVIRWAAITPLIVILALAFGTGFGHRPGASNTAAQVVEGTVTPTATATPSPTPTLTPVPTASITIVKDAHCADLYHGGVYDPYGYGYSSNGGYGFDYYGYYGYGPSDAGLYGPYDQYGGLFGPGFGPLDNGFNTLGYCGRFAFDGHQLGTFTLDGDFGSQTFTVPAGSRYIFTELIRFPWVLRTIDCGNHEDRRQTDITGRSVVIDPLPGQVIRCVFVNVLRPPASPTATPSPTKTPVVTPPPATATPVPATPVIPNITVNVVAPPAPAAPAPIATVAPVTPARVSPPNTGSAGLLSGGWSLSLRPWIRHTPATWGDPDGY